MSDIKAGYFDATVIDYGVAKTQKGDPMAMIRFKFQGEDGFNQEMNWYGTFKHPKAAEISCETLALCGWTTNSPADLAKGKGSGVLNETAQVSLTIKMDEYNGKVSPKIAYVNPVGGGGFRNQMQHADAVQAFAGMNLGGVAAAARQKNAPTLAAVPNHAPGASNPPVFDSEEEVPF